jgi:CubicO group peptidase (beta-lactamase class C family)
MRYIRIFAPLLIFLSGSSALAEPSQRFREWVETERIRSGVPGLSIAVIKDFRIEWAAGFGLADVEHGISVTTDTMFQAASVSKPAAAVAVLIALDRHGLSVEDDVRAPLQRFSSITHAGNWRLTNPFDAKVSIRMLLSHTGGTNAFHYSGYRYAYEAKPPHPIDLLPSLTDELLGRQPANTPEVAVEREPGVTWVYSPAGYTILQAILVGLEDKPFAAAMEDLLLKQIGPTAGTFEQPMPPTVSARIAKPYVDRNVPLVGGPRVFVAAASGGWTATPTGVANFLIAIQKALAGTTQGWITPDIARAATTRQPGRTPDGKCFPATKVGTEACRNSWGLGFDANLNKSFEHEADGSSSGGWFGHSGFNSGYLTLAIASKAEGTGAVIMTNLAPEDMSGDVPIWSFMRRVESRIAEEEGW